MHSWLPLSTICALSIAAPSLGLCSPYWFSDFAPELEEIVITPSATPTPVAAPVMPKMPSQEFWEAALMVGAGYRNDTIKITSTPPSYLPPGEQIQVNKYKELNSVMEVLKFEARVWNFLFNLEGDYAPLVSGKASVDLLAQPGQTDTLLYSFNKLSGYAADAMGSIGYRFECNPHSNFIFAIIPQAGYSYSHQSWEAQNRSEYINSGFTTFLQDQSPQQTDWFGPFVEGRISLSYKGKFFLQPFYQYHFLDYRAVKDYILSVPPGSSEFTYHGAFKSNSAHGQTAGADMFFQSRGGFRIGAKGYWMQYESGKAKVKIHRDENSYLTLPTSTIVSRFTEKTKTTWSNYSVYLYAGYDF